MSGLFKPYPVSLVHRLIEPGPTVMITAAGEDWPSVMTNGFNMPVRHGGLLAVVVGPWDATHESLRRTRECVVAIPGTDLIETTVDVGNSSSADTNKWDRLVSLRSQRQLWGHPSLRSASRTLSALSKTTHSSMRTVCGFCVPKQRGNAQGRTRQSSTTAGTARSARTAPVTICETE